MGGTIPAIRVTRELYDGADGDTRRNRMAFSISFPDGTGCWSHNTANAAARINQYRAAAKRPVDVDWRIGDICCPVQVDGTIAARPAAKVARAAGPGGSLRSI